MPYGPIIFEAFCNPFIVINRFFLNTSQVPLPIQLLISSFKVLLGISVWRWFYELWALFYSIWTCFNLLTSNFVRKRQIPKQSPPIKCHQVDPPVTLFISWVLFQFLKNSIVTLLQGQTMVSSITNQPLVTAMNVKITRLSGTNYYSDWEHCQTNELFIPLPILQFLLFLYVPDRWTVISLSFTPLFSFLVHARFLLSVVPASCGSRMRST